MLFNCMIVLLSSSFAVLCEQLVKMKVHVWSFFIAKNIFISTNNYNNTIHAIILLIDMIIYSVKLIPN